MRLTPQKISLITQTQEVLLDGMKHRRWQRVLPGERVLSQELRISRWTLRAALADLGKQGFLTIAHGHPCAITPKALRSRPRRPSVRNVAILAPAPLSKLRLFVALWVDELRKILSEDGIQLSIYDCPNAFKKNPDHALASLVDRHPHTDWVLLLTTHAIQEWFQKKGHFAVVAGTRFENIRFSAIDVTCQAAGVHAGHTLLGLGHRRLALMNPRVATAGIMAFEAGLKQVIAKSPVAQLEVFACEEEPSRVCSAVDRVFSRSTPPSVLIGARASATLTAFSHLSRRGVKVPQDISIMSVESEPYLDLMVPQIAHYDFSAAKFAAHVARGLRRTSDLSHTISQLSPQFEPGGSLYRRPSEA